MAKRWIVAATGALATLAVTAAAVAAIDVYGANDDLSKVTLDLVTQTSDPGTPLCPAASGIAPLGSGSSAAEGALLAGTQSVAPMSQFLDNGVCTAGGSAGSPSTASGLVVGLGGLSLVGSLATAGTPACNGSSLDCDPATDPAAGAAWSTTITRPRNGAYTFEGWQDVLRVLYGGVSHDPSDTGCNSEIRNTLANNWSAFFQNPACTSGQCTQIRHIFRPDDGTDEAAIFASILGLSPSPSASAVDGFGTSPYCNAVNWDTSAGNSACGLGKYRQYVGPGGIPDPNATDANGNWDRIHMRPPPGTWGDNPDPGQSPYGAAVLPTSYQDNDPIRRTCIGPHQFVGDTVPAEEVCNTDGSLGLVVPVPSVAFIPQQYGGRTPFPTGKCTSFSRGQSFSVHKCAPIGSFGQACPSSDVLFAAACFFPVDANNSSLCENDPLKWPTIHTHPTGDGRIFNLFAFDGGQGYASSLTASRSLAFSGAFARIHETVPLWDSQNGTVPPPNRPCQGQDASDQIGCLVQASPCSFGLTPSTTMPPSGSATIDVAAVGPAAACIENRSYPLWNKVYLNTLEGFQQLTGPQLSLANCEANEATMNTALSWFGFVPLPSTGPDAINGGAPYCEDFDEQVACGATSNANACASNAAAGLPTAATTCGNGIIEALEECDDALANGPLPAGCSSTCRKNPRSVSLGTWTALTNQFPDTTDGAWQASLLGDGSVLVAAGQESKQWYKLTPDATGSYQNGTWSQIANSNVGRAAFASQLLPDGRFWVYGGEYATPCTQPCAVPDQHPTQGEIYDPVANTWTVIPPPPAFPYQGFGIGDDPSVVLPDGSMLVQTYSQASNYTGGTESGVDLFIPSTNSWLAGIQPPPFQQLAIPSLMEAGLTILPDGTAFTVDAANDGVTAYRYDPTISNGNPWIPAAPSPTQLGSGVNGTREIGQQLLLHSGKVLVFGDDYLNNTTTPTTANIGLYTPPGPSNRAGPGSWATSMPVPPSGYTFEDGAASVMSNGNVLVGAAYGAGNSQRAYFEYDPVTNTLQSAPLPPPADIGAMLQLPSGQVLVTIYPFSLYLYTPGGGPQASWNPIVTSIVGPDAKGNYTLTGSQLCGLTTGAGTGDDGQTDTNFPIVEITPVGQASPVYFLRLTSIGDRTPAPGKVTSVQFAVPGNVPHGAYSLRVVTNGIASAPLGRGTAFQY